MVNITINNKPMTVEDGSTILDVAKKANINIPTLCHLNLHNIKMVNDGARCRVCMVDVAGRWNLLPACATTVAEGMVINTHSKKAIKARRTIVELLLSNHPKDCLVCPRNGKCELQSIACDLGVREIKFQGKMADKELDKSSFSLVRNENKCILCGRCETMCNNVQTVGVYSRVDRGFDSSMSTAFEDDIVKTPCTFCGQCVSVCPTAALTEVDSTAEVWDAINNPDKLVVVQTAPAVRAALGELFGLPYGTNVEGKMVSILRQMGFDKVYDTNLAADLTILEEANELVKRLQNKGPLPILTSCCPAWVNFIECNYPELLDIPSTCKSPQEMFGAVAKEYLPKKLEIDQKNLVVVSIMPCIAKKFEATREELSNSGVKNVDYVISTRELGRMIKEAGIDFHSVEDESFDNLMGESTGGAVIFGVTGGVIEAAVRQVAYKLNGDQIGQIDFEQIRGMEGLREATVSINGNDFNIAIAHGLGNARKLLDAVRDGTSKYHAIEIMACPGGCIGGGGQPYYLNINDNILAKRAEALYTSDKNNPKRVSAENTELKAIYDELLGEVGGEKAHELLHTHYFKKAK